MTGTGVYSGRLDSTQALVHWSRAMTTAERISQGSAPGSGLEVIGCLWFWTGFSWRGAGPVAQPPSGSGHGRDGFRRHYRGHGRSHKATALSDGALAGPAR